MSIHNSFAQREIGFGPFGTVLHQLAADDTSLPRDIADPAAVLSEGPHRALTAKIAKDYFNRGATLATTNTFGARRLLPDPEAFKAVLSAHLNIVLEVARTARRVAGIFVSVGPPSDHIGSSVEVDCYDVDDLASVDVGVEQYLQQLEPLARLVDLGGRGRTQAIFPMLETIATARKLRAALGALERLPFEAIVNLTLQPDGKLLDGACPVDTLKESEASLNGARGRIVYGVNCCDHNAADQFLQGVAGTNIAERVKVIALNEADGDPRKHDGCSEHGDVHASADRPETVRALVNHHPVISAIFSCCGSDPVKVGRMKEVLEI